MKYASLKTHAAVLLKVAAAYAEDGAIETAILRVQHATDLLMKARTAQAALIAQLRIDNAVDAANLPLKYSAAGAPAAERKQARCMKDKITAQQIPEGHLHYWVRNWVGVMSADAGSLLQEGGICGCSGVAGMWLKPRQLSCWPTSFRHRSGLCFWPSTKASHPN